MKIVVYECKKQFIRQSHVTKVSYLRIRMTNSLENFGKHQKLNFFSWGGGGLIFMPPTKIGLKLPSFSHVFCFENPIFPLNFSIFSVGTLEVASLLF